MPDTPLTSMFVGASVPDTTITLFSGPALVSTTLAANLTDTEVGVLFVADATLAAYNGYVVIGNELIGYSSRFGIDQLRDLTRGAGGTTPATHSASDVVKIHPRFYFPKALQDAIIDLENRVIAAAATSGVYTPTLTNVANLDGSTAFECQYLRVGNTVTVSGKVNANPTTPATSTQLGISLPIASNLGAVEDCAGVAFAPGIAGQGAAVLGDAANNRAQMEWIAGDTTDQAMCFSFTYQVI